MKFRGIFATLAAALVVAVSAANANAAKLVYTQALINGPAVPGVSDPSVPVGDVLYTIAVQTTAADGTGALGVSLTFTGVAATSPIQLAAKSGGIGNVQQFQDAIDAGTGTLKGTQYADSWFYSATLNNGQVLDIDGNAAVGNPALLYPGLSANPFALSWNTSNSPNSITNTTGSPMSITGLWGNPTALAGDPLLAPSQVGAGVYPLVQLLVPLNSTVPIASGDSLGIATPSGAFYNALGTTGGQGGAGAFVSGNPLAYLTNPLAIPKLASVPEPSTIVLVGLGIAGVLFARRRK